MSLSRHIDTEILNLNEAIDRHVEGPLGLAAKLEPEEVAKLIDRLTKIKLVQDGDARRARRHARAGGVA